jgi:hypothetical protein
MPMAFVDDLDQIFGCRVDVTRQFKDLLHAFGKRWHAVDSGGEFLGQFGAHVFLGPSGPHCVSEKPVRHGP